MTTDKTTENKDTTTENKDETTEKVGDFTPLTELPGNEAVKTTKEEAVELFTGWASSTEMQHAEFDRDQMLVDQWANASKEERKESLENKMTLSDAEELIDTARDVAEEHIERSKRALDLARSIANRLGVYMEEFRSEETAKEPEQVIKAQKAVEGNKVDVAKTMPMPVSSKGPLS